MIEASNGAAPRFDRRGRPLLLLAAGALALACSSGAAGGADVEVLDSAALVQRIESSAARVVLVNFWATWCQPCLAEMPDLVAVRGDFPAQDVEILAVCMDLVSPLDSSPTSADGVSAFAAKHKIDLPVVAMQGELEDAQEIFDVTALPRTIVYTKGEQRSFHEGSASRAEFADMIRAALPPASGS